MRSTDILIMRSSDSCPILERADSALVEVPVNYRCVRSDVITPPIGVARFAAMRQPPPLCGTLAGTGHPGPERKIETYFVCHMQVLWRRTKESIATT